MNGNGAHSKINSLIQVANLDNILQSVGTDITTFSLEQISKLPLEQRKKAVSQLGEKAPDWMLKSLFGENWLGAKLMARYVGGSGDDIILICQKIVGRN